MTGYTLPTSVCVGGVEYPIRTDFRAVLDVLMAMNDPELDGRGKAVVLMEIMFPDWQSIPLEHLEECCKQVCEFIDCGNHDDGRPHPKMIDWEQDAPLIVPAVNSVAHMEVRSVEYMHWWTFWGYFMSVGESLLSSVLEIRQKKAKHKKLEKYEQEFYRENKHLIDFNRKESEEEKAARESIEKWL